MLRSFRVENHKSFREEAELLLIPAYDKLRPAVPATGIVGANASGKSNLLDALDWLQRAVRESYAQWEPGSGVPRTPFRLEPEYAQKPSLYCVELIIDRSRHTYGVEVDDKRVVSEWLYSYPRNRKRVIFEREEGIARLGSTVPEYRTLGAQLARQTRDNALFLSVAAHNGMKEAQPVYQWFRTGRSNAYQPDQAEQELAAQLADGGLPAPLIKLIAAADLGITNITVGPASAPGSSVTERLVADIERATKAGGSESSAGRLSPGDTHALVEELARLGKQIASSKRLLFRHGESAARLTLNEQSAGTRSWLGLVTAALGALRSQQLMVVDEIDASLHPHLSARLVNLFRDPELNAGAAQLLFTTHDAFLLDNDTLARDEIWFVEKEPHSGASTLFPLTDFHPRKNENVVGRYLAGSYGAIPLVSDFEIETAMLTHTADDASA